MACGGSVSVIMAHTAASAPGQICGHVILQMSPRRRSQVHETKMVRWRQWTPCSGCATFAVATVCFLGAGVSQSGVIARQNVPNHTCEGPASPPKATTGLVVALRRWSIPSIPGEFPLPATDEEGVPGRSVVWIPAEIHSLFTRKLSVVALSDRRAPSLALGAGGNRNASGAQFPPGRARVAWRTWVVGIPQYICLCVCQGQISRIHGRETWAC